MNRIYNLPALIILISMIGAIAGCKKEDTLTIPILEASFANKTTGNYFVKDDPNSEYKIPVGLTTKVSSDTKVEIIVSSPTGAAVGVQYNIPSSTVTIPAGEVLSSFVINGLFSGLPTGRKDTLIVSIASGKGAGFADPLISNDTFTLVMQPYCDVIADDFKGDYNNCFDRQEGSADYGPYYVYIGEAMSTGATTGYVVMDNFWDVGGSTKVNLDWSNPSDFQTSIEDQYIFTYPPYGDARIRGIGKGSFSSCDNTFTLIYEVYIPGVGTFGNFVSEVKR